MSNRDCITEVKMIRRKEADWSPNAFSECLDYFVDVSATLNRRDELLNASIGNSRIEIDGEQSDFIRLEFKFNKEHMGALIEPALGEEWQLYVFENNLNPVEELAAEFKMCIEERYIVADGREYRNVYMYDGTLALREKRNPETGETTEGFGEKKFEDVVAENFSKTEARLATQGW